MSLGLHGSLKSAIALGGCFVTKKMDISNSPTIFRIHSQDPKIKSLGQVGFF